MGINGKNNTKKRTQKPSRWNQHRLCLYSSIAFHFILFAFSVSSLQKKKKEETTERKTPFALLIRLLFKCIERRMDENMWQRHENSLHTHTHVDYILPYTNWWDYDIPLTYNILDAGLCFIVGRERKINGTLRYCFCAVVLLKFLIFEYKFRRNRMDMGMTSYKTIWPKLLKSNHFLGFLLRFFSFTMWNVNTVEKDQLAPFQSIKVRLLLKRIKFVFFFVGGVNESHFNALFTEFNQIGPFRAYFL